MVLNWLLVLSPSSVFAFKRRVVLNSTEIRTLPKLMIHTVCGRDCAHKQGLELHGNVHGEGHWFCSDTCCRGFDWRSMVTHHFHRHQAIKSEICPTTHTVGSATRRPVVARRRRIHSAFDSVSGQMRYTCSLCLNGFNCKGSINRHRRNCHKLFTKEKQGRQLSRLFIRLQTLNYAGLKECWNNIKTFEMKTGGAEKISVPPLCRSELTGGFHCFSLSSVKIIYFC